MTIPEVGDIYMPRGHSAHIRRHRPDTWVGSSIRIRINALALIKKGLRAQKGGRYEDILAQEGEEE